MNIIDVLWTISDRDSLVNGIRHGIFPFSEYGKHDKESLFYDDGNPNEGEDGSVRYDVALDVLVDDLHHDIVSKYGTIGDGYKVTVNAVKFAGEDEFEIEMIVEADENSGFGRNDITYYISNGRYYVF